MSDETFIAVGIDGSTASKAAAFWAAGEADARGVPLMLVQAYWLPIGLAIPGVLIRPTIGDDLRSWAESTLSQVEAKLQEQFPDLQMWKHLTRAVPAEALCAISGEAMLTVVGSHGHGEFVNTILGSVAMSLTAHARGPVVVLGGGGRPMTEGRSGPVVACVSGSIDPDALLPTAFEEAAVRGVELIAVHCWNDELPIGYPWPYTRQLREHWVAYELEQLRTRLSVCVESYPMVRSRPVVLVGRAATSILRYLRDDLGDEQPSTVIVGTRGLGRLAGFLIGSTSHTLMTHAPCPVTVVPYLAAQLGSMSDSAVIGEDNSAASPPHRTDGLPHARTSDHDQHGHHRST